MLQPPPLHGQQEGQPGCRSAAQTCPAPPTFLLSLRSVHCPLIPRLAKLYGLYATKNAEIRASFYALAIRAEVR